MSRKNTKGTILAIDMGNTNIVIGCVDDDKVIFEERLSTDLSKTELEYAISFKNVLEIYNIKSENINGAIISSVVPQLVNVIKAAVEKVVDIEPLVVGPGVKTGLNILMDQPKQVGSDLIVDAVAATHDYGAPVIIVDIGTATTISTVDENGNYIKPTSPNGYKFETLILDMIYLMDDCLTFEVDRNKEFAPIKNATGVDSVESARVLLQKNGVEL